ncbi:hypothetical protein [Streptomyces beijiangensis]|nr:hypothetical protein [Streptomyces beijiangensis]
MTTTPASAPAEPQRTPPVPGAVWCNGCDSWCWPTGICGCNNR